MNATTRENETTFAVFKPDEAKSGIRPHNNFYTMA